MKYVHVLKSKKQSPGGLDIVPSILKHTDHVLIPLTDVFNVASPTVDRVEAFHASIVDFKAKYSLYSPKIWVDSGGFAFINGTISASNVGNLIDLYTTYLVRFESDFYRIFSLDLPFNMIDASFNNPTSIYNANIKSLKISREKIMQTPDLWDKFVFVMHFLREGSYPIWSKIYNNLNLRAHIRNRALGGMVGVREGTKNVMSPFLAATFNAYIDFLSGQQMSDQNTFNLHFLGINSVQDRFAIALLEQLFEDYLSPKNSNASFSYDNSRFSETARKGNRTVSAFVQGKRIGLYYVPDYRLIDPTNLVNIYDENLTVVVEKNLRNWIDEGKVEATAIFEPINVHSQVQIDKILHETVKKYKIIDAIWQVNTEVRFEKYVDSLLTAISHGHDLSPQLSDDRLDWIEASLFDNDNFKICTKKNLLEIFRLHKWIATPKNTYKGISTIMKNFNTRWFEDRDSNPSGLPRKS